MAALLPVLLPLSLAWGSRDDQQLTLANENLSCRWTLDESRITVLELCSVHTGDTMRLESGHLPRIVLDGGRVIDLALSAPARPAHREDATLVAGFEDEESGLQLGWSASLDGAAGHVIQTLQLTATRDSRIEELVFVDAAIEGAEQVGRVAGSVVVRGDVFLAVEHPLAENTVGRRSRVRCALPRGNVLKAGRTWRYTSVLGVARPRQMRRDFLSYLESRRAQPYRPFLHYNSWYHLNIDRPDNHMTEAECLATIELLGQELTIARGVKLDAFVWDDGWDDFDSLWGFHQDFPDGFQELVKASEKHGVAQGVWMSPWGGYGEPKQKRTTYGTSRGYETNRNGFSMSGTKYRAAFRDVCLKMMRQHGVSFFKFDGMGGGGAGATGELADDVDAVLELTRELREQDPDLFISATVGTWASPFWLLYADSIWRQGGDTGFHGPGSPRQQWITYRDMFCYRSIVQAGPLYPLNSLMLHGPCIGERANPARMEREEKSVADEIWTFFGSGTGLQELYISPHLLTPSMWDELAAAAKWSRKNTDVLVDTHWIGGDPGAGEVYGWASWQHRGGILVLRNPSDEAGTFELELARDLELPDRHLTDYLLKPVRPEQRPGVLRAESVTPLPLELQPFEVLVFEIIPVAGTELHDAEAYRQRMAEREAARVKAAEGVFDGGSVWEYTYRAQTYQRHFLPDGLAHLYIDGERSAAWTGFTWRVDGARLIVDKPDGSIEEHHLDAEGRLVLPAGLGTARKIPR